MSFIRHRQPAITRLNPHQANRRYLRPTLAEAAGPPLPPLIPEGDPPDFLTWEVGTPITPFDWTPYFSGGVAPLRYVMAISPPGITIDPVTGIMSGTPTAGASGTRLVTCVDDAGQRARHTFQFLTTVPVPPSDKSWDFDTDAQEWTAQEADLVWAPGEIELTNTSDKAIVFRQQTASELTFTRNAGQYLHFTVSSANALGNTFEGDVESQFDGVLTSRLPWSVADAAAGDTITIDVGAQWPTWSTGVVMNRLYIRTETGIDPLGGAVFIYSRVWIDGNP